MGVVSWALVLFAVPLAWAALFGLHRLCLWLEDHGYLYYMRKQPSGGGAHCLVELQKALEPQSHHVHHVKEEKRNQSEQDRGDENGPTPWPGRTVTRHFFQARMMVRQPALTVPLRSGILLPAAHPSSRRDAQEIAMMKAEPQKEHRWLERLVGEWASECEASMGPDQPPMKHTGTQSTRSIGGLWIQGESKGQMPDGGPGTTVLTLGYDPAKKRFVGTFIGSMMYHLWVYDGQLDTAEKVLTLDTEGPSLTDPTKNAKYQDCFEIVSDDHHILYSQLLGEDGQWHRFMTAHYRRVN
jgi:hypothetical protein